MAPACRSRTVSLSASLLLAVLLLAPSSRSGAAADSRDASVEQQPQVRDEDREVEQISDEEMARRAAESPDQHPGGFVSQVRGPSITALGWGFLGPEPILKEYWSGRADAGGRVSAIAVDPRNGNVVYLAAAQGGVWKSVDGGTTWTPLTDQLTSLASGALAFDPVNPDILYYGTGEQHYSGDSFYGDGLFRTPDAGATWFKIAPKASVGSYIARVAVKPTDVNLIYVASDLGVVRSTDGGVNWTVVLSGGHANDLAIDPSTPSTVYAGIRGVGVHKSVDDGATWSLLGGGLPTSGFLRINLGLSPSNPLVIYASFVNTGGGLLGMYRSADGGTSWTQLTATPNYLGSQGWYDNCVTVDPTNPNICYAGGVFPYTPTLDFGVIKTTNGGGSWSDITKAGKGQLHPDQHFITFGPGGTLWVANDGGVWKSTNGGSGWTNCNHDLALAQLYSNGVHPTDANTLLGGTQDNGTLRYTGAVSWPQLKEGDGGPSAVEWASPSTWYSTYVGFSPLYRWVNNGKNYAIVTGPWGSDRKSFASGPLIIDPNVANTLLVGTHRVWKSGNSGTSWVTISPDLTAGGVLRSLAVATGNSNVIYSGSNDGRVYVTTDGGTVWNPRYTGIPVRPIPDVFIDPADSQRAYLCADQSTGDRVFTTADAGVTWTSVTGNLADGVRALSLAVDFAVAPPRLYLGTDYGVYSSADGGTTWVKDSAGIPNCAVYDVNVDAAHNRLLAATHGRGAWSASLAGAALAFKSPGNEATDRERSPGVALRASSNPFRAPVALTFEMTRRGSVSLVLFDVSGRIVRVLDQGVREPGVHALWWDGRDASGRPAGPGIYFALLARDGDRQVQRLAMMR